jgi:hypothetical protein
MAVLLLLFGALMAFSARAAWMEQSINLVEGWNAIHLKVNPFDSACAKVFGEGTDNRLAAVIILIMKINCHFFFCHITLQSAAICQAAFFDYYIRS